MKTNIIALVAIIALTFSCKEKTTTEEVVVVEEVEVIDENVDDNGIAILLGAQERETLESEPYNEWFMNSYKNHTIDVESLTAIKEGLKDVRITIFMGTWCEDSQREVPAFFKILDEVDYESETVKLITVSQDKTAPEELVKGKDITNVPTFIFMKDGQELGRIVEYPLESLEKDMAKILSGADYKHAYAE
ncbi:thioredoxin family protein [Dokdonia sp. Asnod3-C12]|uniref:thioredoxin family protein n=1 Tax=Dokdonia sp. Asnod3-C12 TaxID=3160575 RepID=UPI0030EC54B7|tara:strand:+ start:17649 stop:18221 length:573 start_codon:yes stop_codon:yes gene_type:complete